MFASRIGFFGSVNSVFGNNAYWGNISNGYLQTTLGGTNPNLINFNNTSGYTLEYWIYVTSWPDTAIPNPGPGNKQIGGAGQSYWSFGPHVNGNVQLYVRLLQGGAGGNISIRTANNTLTTNTWYNLAMVATTSGSNTTVSFYVNGNRQQISSDGNTFANTYTFSQPYDNGGGYLFSMGKFANATQNTFWSNTYFDSLRVSNINRYSGSSYVVSQNQFTADANTVLLLNCDGANNSTTFIDSSNNALSITNNNNEVIQTNTNVINV